MTSSLVNKCQRIVAWVKERISPDACRKCPTPDPIQSLITSVREVLPANSKCYARRTPQGIEVGILWATGFAITVFPSETSFARIVGWAYDKANS